MHFKKFVVIFALLTFDLGTLGIHLSRHSQRVCQVWSGTSQVDQEVWKCQCCHKKGIEAYSIQAAWLLCIHVALHNGTAVRKLQGATTAKTPLSQEPIRIWYSMYYMYMYKYRYFDLMKWNPVDFVSNLPNTRLFPVLFHDCLIPDCFICRNIQRYFVIHTCTCITIH